MRAAGCDDRDIVCLSHGDSDLEGVFAFSSRFLMAMFGGIALIAPTLIMALYPSRNTSLITTSIATFLFASVLALGAKDSSGKDVLAATAAYAAVLVVFIGTSLSATPIVQTP
jgi:hypothetical protein